MITVRNNTHLFIRYDAPKKFAVILRNPPNKVIELVGNIISVLPIDDEKRVLQLKQDDEMLCQFLEQDVSYWITDAVDSDRDGVNYSEMLQEAKDNSYVVNERNSQIS